MKKRVKVAGLKVFYRQWGQGRPLVLLHGWGKSGEVFETLAADLKRNFQVLAPDLPGFGHTPSPRQTWGVPEYSQFVKSFLETLSVREFSLLGHSLGGRLAIQLATDFPQEVKKLVLTGVPVKRGKRIKRLVFYLVAKIFKIVFLLPPLSFFKNLFRKALYRLAGEQDYYRSQGKMRQVFQTVIRDEAIRFLPKIKCSTLIVWGELDRVTPLSQGEILKRGIEKAQLVVIPGASHKLPYEMAKEFFKVIEPFLKT